MRHYILALASLGWACGTLEHPPRPEVSHERAPEARQTPHDDVTVTQVMAEPETVLEPASEPQESVAEAAAVGPLDPDVEPGDTGLVRLSVIFILDAQAAGTLVDIKTVGGYLPFKTKDHLTVDWNDVPSQTEIDNLKAARQTTLLQLRLSGIEPPDGIEIIGGRIDPLTGDVTVRFFVTQAFTGTLETRVQFWAASS